MEQFFVRHLSAADLRVQAKRALIPYSDHRFLATDVRAAWIGRNNCEAGGFFHHRPAADMTRVSCPLVARIVSAAGAGLAELADCEVMPFEATPQPARIVAAAMWDELFGGWAGFAAADAH